MPTRNLAIMFTDIKGFTQRTSASSRDAMRALLEQHERLLVPVFAYFDGTVVKTIGDAFLVYFESPTDAVLCGVTIQEVLRQHNAVQAEADRLEVRVAINVGEVEQEANDILGEAVNIAARLEGVTEAGEVWFTDAVYQTMNRTEAPSAEVGERLFKGIPHPIRVYKVLQEPDSDLAQQLAQGVKLHDGVPRLDGIRLSAPGSKDVAKTSRCRRTVVASALLLALSVLAVYLIPSTEEMALEKTHQLLAEGNPADALLIADKVLAEKPDSEPLRELAVRAARAQLDKLVATGDIRAAEGWLQRQLETKSYLEPLHVEVMRLEARLAVDSVIRDTRYSGVYRPLPLQQFLQRYAQSAEAPLQALALLEGSNVPGQTRYWLMQTAMQRGQAPDDALYRFCIEELEGGRIDYEFFRALRGALRDHFSERARSWAESALEGTHPQAYMNAWQLLTEMQGSDRLVDPYYQALNGLIGSFSIEPLERARGVFAVQQEAGRRAQLIGFVGELVESYPKFISSRDLRTGLEELRLQLGLEWGLVSTR